MNNIFVILDHDDLPAYSDFQITESSLSLCQFSFSNLGVMIQDKIPNGIIGMILIKKEENHQDYQSSLG